MPITAKILKDIMAEARPVIERQMNDAKLIAGFRDVIASNGGDWSALKALIKAHVEDEHDDAGDGKRVKKILDKADSSNAYAEMLGLANMNEENFSAESKSLDPKLVEMIAKGVQTETGRKALITAIDIMIDQEEAELPPHDKSTGELLEEQPARDEPAAAAEVAGEYLREPVAAEQGQIVREGDAPRETSRDYSGDASRPDTNSEMDRATEGSFETGSVEAENALKAMPASPDAGSVSHAGAGEIPAINSSSEDEFVPLSFQIRKMDIRELRPHCLNPSNCGGSGSKHCHACLKAAAEGEAA